ncbi:citrate/2-methylcitrate synthase [Micromonospora sp. NPDC048170]|uniref:citrate/2-methylcitrate synthase n=1 Tax=Micromonospora sp. NPDC048170 TaxID=3154819 RepID=UPI00340CE568
MKTRSSMTAAPRTAAVKDAGPKLVGASASSSCANAGAASVAWPTARAAPVMQVPARIDRRLRGIVVSVRPRHYGRDLNNGRSVPSRVCPTRRIDLLAPGGAAGASGGRPGRHSRDRQPARVRASAVPQGDPRGATLLDLVADLPIGGDLRRAVDDLTATAARQGALPNVDFALAVLAHATGMGPGAAEVVFAVARTAGWIAHVNEEYAQPANRFRWNSGYTGPPPTSP